VIHRTKLSALSGALVSSFVTAAAIAQDTGDRSTSFQAVTGSAHEDVPGGNLLVAAYAIALFVLALYVLYLTAMQQAAGKELTRLEALLNARAAKSEKKD
jgi:hypothetical protein